MDSIIGMAIDGMLPLRATQNAPILYSIVLGGPVSLFCEWYCCFREDSQGSCQCDCGKRRKNPAGSIFPEGYREMTPRFCFIFGIARSMLDPDGADGQDCTLSLRRFVQHGKKSLNQGNAPHELDVLVWRKALFFVLSVKYFCVQIYCFTVWNVAQVSFGIFRNLQFYSMWREFCYCCIKNAK